MAAIVSFYDVNPEVCDALRGALDEHGMKGVEVQNMDIFRSGANALVAPGNSFGVMDGGFDLLVATRWPKVAEMVKRVIATRMYGELLVGQAIIIPTGTNDIKWVIYTPTMRAPEELPASSLAPYHAVRAAMLMVDHVEWPNSGRMVSADVGSVAIPGMGTGTGMLEPKVAAQRMVLGLKMARSQVKMPASGQEAVRFDRMVKIGRQP